MKKHLRHDKTCLNCGATVEERYCSRCGQENIETKDSFIHLVTHFFEDLTHYDSKFFITIKDLLIKPGFLTSEYLSGKRVKYLHPIRMYMFISFLYFLMVFSSNHRGHQVEEGLISKATYEVQKHFSDSIKTMLIAAKRDTVNGAVKEAILTNLLTKLKHQNDYDREHFNFTIVGSLDYYQLRSYDSLQKSLPESEREHSIKSWIYSRWLSTINHYGEGTIALLIDKTQHIIPKMMFILLPLFALFFKIFYSGDKFLYTDHAIFSIHFHSAVFLLFLFFGILNLIFPFLSPYTSIAQLILPCIYLAIALRSVYRQSVTMSVVKTIALVLLYSISITIGFLAVTLITLL